MTQHSEEQIVAAPLAVDSTWLEEDALESDDEQTVVSDTSKTAWIAYFGTALLMAVCTALGDFGAGKPFNVERMLETAGLCLVFTAPFFFLKQPSANEEDLTPEPFTSKASELPRLLKKAVQVMHLSAEDEEANFGVWRALSYLSKKLEPGHKTVFTEDAIGDLKGFLASETRRDRLESLVRIAAIAADPELLPLLRDLKDRTKDLDVLDNLRVALRDAISSCAKFA